jgi:hypothetical protein
VIAHDFAEHTAFAFKRPSSHSIEVTVAAVNTPFALFNKLEVQLVALLENAQEKLERKAFAFVSMFDCTVVAADPLQYESE